jgi:hypothetical protein
MRSYNSKTERKTMRGIAKTASLIFLLIIVPLTPLAAQSTTSYMIHWAPNPEPEVAGYVIFRSLSQGSGFEAIDSVDASTTSYIDTDLEKGTFYFYRLKAKDAEGNRGLFSNLVSGMTIPQDADAGTDNLCQITDIQPSGNSGLTVDWSTDVPSIGFVQYDRDATLDSMSTWDDASYEDTHTSETGELLAPSTYYLRAVSYTSDNMMIVSAVDTFEFTGENPTPLSAPELSIFPVPYHPGSGGLSLMNLPENGAVAIYDGNGLEIWRKEVGTQTAMTWNGENQSGGSVMSGVYYVVTLDSAGDVFDRRPIMIVN